MTAETLPAERASDLCQSIRQDVGGIRERLVELYDGRGWEALGYDSWFDLCSAEFGTAVGELLPRSERKVLVAQLTEAGMTTPAIGSALGITDRTARRDRHGQDVQVTGVDGRTYQPRTPKKQKRDPGIHAARTFYKGVLTAHQNIAKADEAQVLANLIDEPGFGLGTDAQQLLPRIEELHEATGRWIDLLRERTTIRRIK